MRIPLSNIGSPKDLTFSMAVINEAAGSETTYAGVPNQTFADGYNPTDFIQYYRFDLHGTIAPFYYPPMGSGQTRITGAIDARQERNERRSLEGRYSGYTFPGAPKPAQPEPKRANGTDVRRELSALSD